jgi:hypothetical protein
VIKVSVTPPNDVAWDRWIAKCIETRDKLIATVASGSGVTINTKVYKGQKNKILTFFHGKCAYCESAMSYNQDGDLDHFRPKAEVSDENDVVVMVTQPDGSMKPHPGYYWLAYEWRNLFPTCIRCNRPYKRKGEPKGKSTRFPVAGFRAVAEGEEAHETALLLNPYDDDPATHLRFDSLGVVQGLTPKGVMTEAVLDLNRDTLPEARRDVYASVQALFYRVLNAGSAQGPDIDRDRQALREYSKGHKPFGAVAQLAIADVLAEVDKLKRDVLS